MNVRTISVSDRSLVFSRYYSFLHR